jgi:hypothetical protein
MDSQQHYDPAEQLVAEGRQLPPEAQEASDAIEAMSADDRAAVLDYLIGWAPQAVLEGVQMQRDEVARREARRAAEREAE